MIGNRFERLKQLCAVQAKEFYRDFGSVFFSLVFPLFFVVVLIITNLLNPTFKFEFALVDAFNNPQARTLAEALASIPGVGVRSMTGEAAQAALVEGKVHAIALAPAGDLAGGRAQIELISNNRYAGFARIALQAARAQLVGGSQADLGGYPFRTRVVTDKGGSDFAFVFPGMLALALIQLGLFATATPLLRARERGTLRHLLLTPLPVHELVISQVGLRFCIAAIQICLLLAVGMLVLDLGFQDWLAVLAVACLGTIMLITLGYALAGLAPSLETGMTIIMIANFAMMFGGNIFWNPESSIGLRYIAHLLPTTYLADLFRQVVNHTAGLHPKWLDSLVLAGWTLLALAITAKTFRFDMQPRETRAAAA